MITSKYCMTGELLCGRDKISVKFSQLRRNVATRNVERLFAHRSVTSWTKMPAAIKLNIAQS